MEIVGEKIVYIHFSEKKLTADVTFNMCSAIRILQEIQAKVAQEIGFLFSYGPCTNFPQHSNYLFLHVSHVLISPLQDSNFYHDDLAYMC